MSIYNTKEFVIHAGNDNSDKQVYLRSLYLFFSFNSSGLMKKNKIK